MKIIGVLVLIALILGLIVGEFIGISWLVMWTLNQFGVEVGLKPAMGAVFLFHIVVSALKMKSK